MPPGRYPPARSRDQIEDYAQLLRKLLGVADEAYFNMVAIVENGLSQALPEFSLEVATRSHLKNVEAFTEFDPLRIVAREDVYEGAYRDDVRSRFTIAHELGHLCLHWGYPRPRLSLAQQKFGHSSVNARVENEANQFAGAFLIPRVVARRLDDPVRLAKLCRVSKEAASVRLNELLHQSEEFSVNSVRNLFGSNSQSD